MWAEKLKTKTVNNYLKQVCCKEKERGSTAVGQPDEAELS